MKNRDPEEAGGVVEKQSRDVQLGLVALRGLDDERGQRLCPCSRYIY